MQYWNLPRNDRVMPVHPVSRVSFEIAFGISVSQQLLCEKYFSLHNFALEGKVVLPEFLDDGTGRVTNNEWNYFV